MPQGGVIMRKYKLLSAFLVLAISSGLSIPAMAAGEYDPGAGLSQEHAVPETASRVIEAGTVVSAETETHEEIPDATEKAPEKISTSTQRRLIPDDTSNNYAGKRERA